MGGTGHDVLAKAKTGTGKTVAFLVRINALDHCLYSYSMRTCYHLDEVFVPLSITIFFVFFPCFDKLSFHVNYLQLPAIEHIIKLRENSRVGKRSPINVLAICPTRELATQVATEAKMLTTFQRGLGVQVVIGGTNMATETRRLEKSPCQVLSFNTSY